LRLASEGPNILFYRSGKLARHVIFLSARSLKETPHAAQNGIGSNHVDSARCK
jgi:hypothetical protein